MRKIALIATINGQKRYVGKIIDDIFYRNFPFSDAVLWHEREISFDHRAFLYIKSNGVKKIIFLDPVKKWAFEVGIQKFESHMRLGEYSEGEQVYIAKELLKKLKEYPQIPFIKTEIDISDEGGEPVFDNKTNTVSFRKKQGA